MKKLRSKNTQSSFHPDKARVVSKLFFKRRKTTSAPGPGDSQESDRMEYHEEPSSKVGTKKYDHEPEKDLGH